MTKQDPFNEIKNMKIKISGLPYRKLQQEWTVDPNGITYEESEDDWAVTIPVTLKLSRAFKK